MRGAGPELESLWACVFGEPPSVSAPARLTADILVAHLPLAPPYTPSCVQRSADREGAEPFTGGSRDAKA